MFKAEEEFVEKEVKESIMPEIKALLPGFLRLLLRLFFPKIEQKLIDRVTELADTLLNNRKNRRSTAH